MTTTEPSSGQQSPAASRDIASRLLPDAILARIDELDGRARDAAGRLARIDSLDARLEATDRRVDSAQGRLEGVERFALALVPRLDGTDARVSRIEAAHELRIAAVEATHALRVAALEAEQARLRASMTSGRELLRLLLRLLLGRLRARLLGSPPSPPAPSPVQSMLARIDPAHASSSPLRIPAEELASAPAPLVAGAIVIVDCPMGGGATARDAAWADAVRDAVAILWKRGFAAVDACVDAPCDGRGALLSVAFVRRAPGDDGTGGRLDG